MDRNAMKPWVLRNCRFAQASSFYDALSKEIWRVRSDLVQKAKKSTDDPDLVMVLHQIDRALDDVINMARDDPATRDLQIDFQVGPGPAPAPAPEAPAPEGKEFDLEKFASRAQAATNSFSTDRPGGEYIYIIKVWEKYQGGDPYGLTLDEFKGKLLEAHRARLIKLQSTDIVRRGEKEEYRASQVDWPETRQSYHTIRVQ